MTTIAQVITNLYVSSYKAALYNAKQAMFSPALAAPNSSVKILMVAYGLDWGNGGGAQTDQSLVSVANYGIWISGKFYLEATTITGAGGGSVVPVPPGGLTPNRIDFVVSGSSYMVTGDVGITITQFIGFNLEFDRNGVPQSAVITEPTYFTWDKTTGEFTCFPELALGEVIALIPV